MYEHGFVVGKFLPCHAGHHYLVNTAASQCENLTVAVCRDETFDTIPAAFRARWMQEMHPNVLVIIIDQLQGRDNDSKAWADYTKEILDGQVPDVVFTSEEYGETWARELGCEHVQVDIDRATFPISGTQVRADPYGSWDYCCPPSKAFFAKRVCLIGGESVGKTTMAANLARHYDTVWCAEYGRHYVEEHGVDQADMNIWSEILYYQPFWEAKCAEACNKLLICDTDLITTSVWYERWVGNRDGLWTPLRVLGREWANDNYDLYLFLTDEVEWINDGTRSEGEPEVRQWFSNQLLAAVDQTNVPVVTITGTDYDKRTQECIKHINSIMK